VKAGRRHAFVVVVLVTAAGIAACSHSPGPLPRGTISFQSVSGPVSLRVEIAQTEQDRERGLMGRRILAADAGMAFLFPTPTEEAFWMKDTPIPLAVAFWGRSGRIVAIMEMIPCRADPCPLYSPHASYVGAVEANRGFFAMHEVHIGDHIALAR
jgi:uncharacterized protein